MLPHKILLLYILWLLAYDVHVFEWSIFASIVWFVYSWNICILYEWTDSKIQGCYKSLYRDGQNHHMLMILKSKSNHLNIGDLKSKSKSFYKWWFENQNHIEIQMILKSF